MKPEQRPGLWSLWETRGFGEKVGQYEFYRAAAGIEKPAACRLVGKRSAQRRHGAEASADRREGRMEARRGETGAARLDAQHDSPARSEAQGDAQDLLGMQILQQFNQRNDHQKQSQNDFSKGLITDSEINTKPARPGGKAKRAGLAVFRTRPVRTGASSVLAASDAL